MKASESRYSTIEAIPFGFSKLDKLTGVGGVPMRRLTEISGVFSVGKSTIALTLISQAQKLGKECLWVDSETSFDNSYASSLGVDITQLDLFQADELQNRFGENLLDEIESWAVAHTNGLIVLDSVGQLVPQQEAEKTAAEKSIAGQARIVSVFCRKIGPILAIRNNALVVLNHQKTSFMTGRLFTPGGDQLAHTKSLHLILRKLQKRVMRGDQRIGDVIEFEVRKNKVGKTLFQKTELVLLYGEGFSQAADKLEEMMESGEITKKGNTYYHGEVKIGIGENRAREYVKNLYGKVAE